MVAFCKLLNFGNKKRCFHLSHSTFTCMLPFGDIKIKRFFLCLFLTTVCESDCNSWFDWQWVILVCPCFRTFLCLLSQRLNDKPTNTHARMQTQWYWLALFFSYLLCPSMQCVLSHRVINRLTQTHASKRLFLQHITTLTANDLYQPRYRLFSIYWYSCCAIDMLLKLLK